MNKFEKFGQGGQGEGGVEIPPGREREVSSIKFVLEDMAKMIAGGADVTEEMLREDWPAWQKKLEKAKSALETSLKNLNFSWDSKVIEHIRTTSTPLEKALFAAARGVLGDYEAELLKTLRQYEKEEERRIKRA